MLDKKCLTVNHDIESKDGQRSFLSSNKGGNRCPFLDCNSHKPLTDSNIEALTSIAVLLKKTHIRLILEGYTIKDGHITPPKRKE